MRGGRAYVCARVWACRCGRVEAWAWVRACPRGCMCRYSYGCVGVRAYGRVGGLVFFLVETLYFLIFLFFLLIPVCFSITRATTQFTLVTAHHAWSDPFAAVWLLSDFFCFFSPCRDPDLACTPTSTWRCSRMCSPIQRQRAGIFAADKRQWHFKLDDVNRGRTLLNTECLGSVSQHFS